MENLLTDVRLAMRQLAAAPGFTFVAALTLALGIGVNSAIFGLADAALMRPLPFGQADGLVMLWERTPKVPKSSVSPLNWRDWREQSQLFADMAYIQTGIGRAAGRHREFLPGARRRADRGTHVQDGRRTGLAARRSAW
jgi:hypothetical protein